MSIFLDTSDLREIERFYRMGIVRGVTTNPTILLREGLAADAIPMRAQEIAKIISPYPLSVEVTETEYNAVIQEARQFASWADNIVVKVTIHGPDGELENLEIIHELETRYAVRVNVTAMMSAQQCLLAAMAGASYVSLFGGRVNNMGYDVRGEITKLRKLLDTMQLSAQIIVGSTREVLNIIEWLEAGAHIVTVTPDLLKGMIVHPYSKETVRQFLDDARKAKELAGPPIPPLPEAAAPVGTRAGNLSLTS